MPKHRASFGSLIGLKCDRCSAIEVARVVLYAVDDGCNFIRLKVFFVAKLI